MCLLASCSEERERERRTGETGHCYAIGTLDLCNNTVGLDSGGNSSNEGE
jgi:hypothetical protein